MGQLNNQNNYEYQCMFTKTTVFNNYTHFIILHTNKELLLWSKY